MFQTGQQRNQWARLQPRQKTLLRHQYFVDYIFYSKFDMPQLFLSLGLQEIQLLRLSAALFCRFPVNS